MITRQQVKYRITSFDKNEGTIEVQYEPLDRTFSLNLFLNHQGLFPVGEELDIYIRSMCPLETLNRHIMLESGISNASEIEALVQPILKTPINDLNDLFSVLKE